MNNILNVFNTAWLYIGLIGFLILKIFEFMKAHNKPVPEKYNSIYEIAQFLVAQFDILDMSNEEKKSNATSALIKQAKVDGKNITETVAKGAIETAVNERRKENTDSNDMIGFSTDNGVDNNGNDQN